MRLRSLLAATALGIVAPAVGVALDPATSVAVTATATATAGTVPDDGSGATIVENPFLPDERDIGDCASSLPKPDCGSDARGGWQQATVFAVLMCGMAFIGWRIFRAVRRRDRQMPDVAD